MYHAKSLGGSRTELFDAGARPSVSQPTARRGSPGSVARSTKTASCSTAQPIVDLATGAIVQHELLLRMRRLRRPADPAAGVPPHGREVRPDRGDRPMGHQAGDQDRRSADSRSAVNLSASSAGDPRMLDLIERELRQHDADPGNLVFEITETAVMQNMDRATPIRRAAGLARLPASRSGRLRHRVRQLHLPQAPPGALPEDRHRLRARRCPQQARHVRRPGDRRPRRRLRPADDRRRRRGRSHRRRSSETSASPTRRAISTAGRTRSSAPPPRHL